MIESTADLNKHVVSDPYGTKRATSSTKQPTPSFRWRLFARATALAPGEDAAIPPAETSDVQQGSTLATPWVKVCAANARNICRRTR